MVSTISVPDLELWVSPATDVTGPVIDFGPAVKGYFKWECHIIICPSSKDATTDISKGQLISEWLFGVFNFQKKTKEIFFVISALESKK